MINRNEVTEPIPSSTKEEIPMEIDEGPKRAAADAQDIAAYENIPS